MKAFWREYWVWIVVPIVVVLALAVIAVLVAGDDASSGIYRIY